MWVWPGLWGSDWRRLQVIVMCSRVESPAVKGGFADLAPCTSLDAGACGRGFTLDIWEIPLPGYPLIQCETPIGSVSEHCTMSCIMDLGHRLLDKHSFFCCSYLHISLPTLFARSGLSDWLFWGVEEAL